MRNLFEEFQTLKTKMLVLSDLRDVKLPKDFIQGYSSYISEKQPNGYASIAIGEYSSTITTSTGRIIYLPNEWFYIAAQCSGLIEILDDYRRDFKEIFQNEPSLQDVANKLKKCEKITEIPTDYSTLIGDFYNTNDARDLFNKFVSDYVSWGGGKTIDRQDYYVSPVMKVANLLAETQSGIAEIANQFKDNQHLAELLNDNIAPYFGEQFELKLFTESIEKVGLILKKNSSYRFVASLLSKPFVILTGLSGSGKTKLAQAFAKWICNLGLSKYQSIIDTTVKYTEKSIENSFGWTLKKDVIEQLIGEDDKYVKSNIAGIDLERCKLEYKNIFYYKTDEQKENLSKKIKEEYSIGDEIPVKIFINRENDNHGSNQYKLIPVGSDWTNREPLLGYPNALETGKYVKPENGVLDLILNANKNPDKPYFLILDEMNLSHVERYFADFLSAMESEEEIPLHPDLEEWKDENDNWNDGIPDKIKLPKNLFVIGTVNIDETTYMFSPKVLDRANVLEFRVEESNLKSFMINPAKPDLDLIRGKGAGMATDFVKLAKEKPADFEDSETLNQTLLEFFDVLKKTGSEFGYRTASEIYSFCSKLNTLTKDEEITFSIDEMIDAAVLQKLLPKLHGSRKKLEPVLNSLAILCLNDEQKKELLKLKKGKNPNIGSDLNKIVYDENEDIDNDKIRFKLSLEKILRMKKRVIQDGFTSFAEA
jgi:hypothetical protein